MTSKGGGCPLKCDGHGFWLGLVAGALLTYSHIGMIKAVASKKKKVVRAPGNKAWRMSKWVKCGGVVRTQGLCGDFSKMPGSSVGQQTEEALAALDAILKDAGVERKDLIAITIFIADYKNDFEEMNKVYDAWVDKAGLPTRLCVQAGMGVAKVEVRAEAYCGEDDE